MARKNAFVRISGDLVNREDVLEWIRELTGEYFVAICIGGGTQINEAFEAAGIPVGKHGPLGREIERFETRQLARDILERNQVAVQDMLHEAGILALAIIPVMEVATVLCHINGDEMVRLVHNGYDALYVLTTEDRVAKKKKQFAELPKIQVKGFPVEES